MVKRTEAWEIDNKQKTKLKSIIDEKTVEVATANPKVRASLYASDYGQCQRKTFFQFFPQIFPPDAEIDARVYRIFANGNDVHERLGGYLKLQPEIDFRDELNVPRDELDVHGRCDGICVIDDQAVVVEFKSINKEAVDAPKEEHVGQLTWYLTMFRKLRKEIKEDFGYAYNDLVQEADLIGEESLSGRTLESLDHVEKWLLFTQGEIRGEIIYESKQNNETFHFPLEWDQGKSDKVRLWFEQVKWHVDNREIPAVKYNSRYYPCAWGSSTSLANRCQYWETCWGKNAELLQINGLKRG